MMLALLNQAYFTTYLSLLGLFSPDIRHEALSDRVLQKYPLIDQHVDLPVIYRILHRNDVSHVNYHGPLESHVDLDRLIKGGSGGFFSIAYVPCYGTDLDPKDPNTVFNAPNQMVRDTLEQIDVTKQLVAQYSEVRSGEGVLAGPLKACKFLTVSDASAERRPCHHVSSSQEELQGRLYQPSYRYRRRSLAWQFLCQ
jgi:hypothetical protein